MSDGGRYPQTPEQHRKTHMQVGHRCVYCGAPLTASQSQRWPGTCASHADLPARDPNYMAGLGRGAA